MIDPINPTSEKFKIGDAFHRSYRGEDELENDELSVDGGRLPFVVFEVWTRSTREEDPIVTHHARKDLHRQREAVADVELA